MITIEGKCEYLDLHTRLLDHAKRKAVNALFVAEVLLAILESTQSRDREREREREVKVGERVVSNNQER